tara:strand:- start:20016 stop:20885 length:870 start_codon:yes stop_codon:yes gene_type:complete
MGCALVALIFSFHYIAAKEVMSAGITPYALSSFRGIVGGLLILLMFRKKIVVSHIRSNIVSILIMGFLGFFINQIFFMNGLKLSSALNGALISNTIPVVSFIFAFFAGVERGGLKKSLGVAISFSCVTYLVFNGSGDTGSVHNFLNMGNLYIFLNVVSFCAAFVLGKKVMNGDIAFEMITGLMLLFGGSLMLFVAREEMLDVLIYLQRGKKEFLLILFETIMSTSVVYYLNLWTLKKLNVSKVTFFAYLQPIITAIGEIFFLQKYPELIAIIPFVGILFGGVLILRDNS